MTDAAPLAFPGSRTLADWWRQLAAWRPQAFWVAHLLLHRVEVPVRLARSLPLDPLARLVLRAVALEEAHAESGSGDRLAALDRYLHVGPSWLAALLGGLRAHGLVWANGNEPPRLTALGRQAVAADAHPDLRPERRVFYFAESGRADQPPHFLNLTRAATAPWPAGAGWTFDVSVLEACLARAAEWKQRHGFATDVQALVRADTEAVGPASSAWQRIVLDRAEHAVLALLRVSPHEGEARLLGFSAQPDSWALHGDRPALTLAGAGLETFPELAEDPPLEQWRQAWLAWCQPRGFPASEATECGLERQGPRLRVTVPASWLTRLEGHHGDVLRGKAWLLAGEGRIRAAAQLEIVPRT